MGKNRKGFTLIELIAVILIIGIIAIILVPPVLKIMENSRQKAFLTDVNNLLEMATVDTQKNNYEYLSYQISENKITNGKGEIIQSEGNDKLYGTIEFDDYGKSTLAIHNDKWCAIKTSSQNTIEIKKYEEGNCEIESVKEDSGKPTIVSVSISPNTWTNEVVLTGKAKDFYGIVGYQFSKDPNVSKDDTNWNTIESSKEVEHTYVVNENDVYYYYVKDESGNVASKSVIVGNIDNVGPEILVSKDTGVSQTKEVSINIKEVGTGLSEENSYQYYLSSSETALTGGTWSEYESGKKILLEGNYTGKYYLFIKQIVDHMNLIMKELFVI